ncbi:MAG: hypothetical protein IPO40_23125 [Fibrobacteres bacterium]|nr:hypothetical protein [Fibrobacterota bacterium]
MDLSPGGIGLVVDPPVDFQVGQALRLEIRFGNQEKVVREGILRHSNKGRELGLEWPAAPAPWGGVERRNHERLRLDERPLWGRIPVPHAHRVWSRLQVLDVNSDLGMMVQTVGGPGYLLPGHVARIHLDLAFAGQLSWECQVLWCRPASGQGTLMGLRLLELDSVLRDALGQWLELHRARSPMALQRLGFRKSLPPGQFRFRKVEAAEELRELSSVIGERENSVDLVRIGCWEGPRLVGGADLLVDPGLDATRLATFFLHPDWLVPDAFLGLWEQVIRHFLGTGTRELRLDHLEGRERIFQLAGLKRMPGDEGWLMRRESILFGSGIGSIRWRHLYGEVAAFARGNAHFSASWRPRLASLLRTGLWYLLRDWREPAIRRALHREIELWARSLESRNPISPKP